MTKPAGSQNSRDAQINPPKRSDPSAIPDDDAFSKKTLEPREWEQEQLFQAERRQRELAERLQQTALLKNSSLEIKHVLEFILDQLGHVFPYESGSILTLEENAMRVIAVRNQPVDIVGRRYALDKHEYNRRMAKGETVIIPDTHDAQYGWVFYDDTNHVRSSIGVPLWIRGHVIGALSIDSSTARAYTKEDVRVIQAFAQQAAIALENARLFEEQRTQRELAEALAAAAAVVGSTLDLEQVLDRILEQAARVVNGDIFNILMIYGDKGKFVRWRGYDRFGISDQDISQVKIPVFEYPKLVQMIETGESVLVADIFESPDWVRSNPYQKYLRSYVAAPIRITEQIKGFLNVNGTRSNQFSIEDAQRLKAFADYAAIAIQNANLFQQERNYADDLERQVRRRTAQLEAQNAWLQAVLSSTADGIIVTDGAGEIVQTNRVVDTWLNQTLSSEDAKQLCDTIRDIARYPKKQGDLVLELTGLDLQLSAAPISDMGTEGPATVVAVHDVGHLKALDRMKSRFVSDVSHELRTPITSIRLYANLIRSGIKDRLDQYLDALAQEAERLSVLVEDILQISRIESSKVELNVQPIDLNILAEAVVASHIVLAESHELNMTYHSSTHNAIVKVDPDKFTQVLNNLVENAINYTPRGGHIHVSTGAQVIDRQKWATVSVRDTGIGISEDEVDHIFDRFFRGEGPRKMQIQGTGLGLSIVKEILQLHHGDVSVESQVGVGSTFTVKIPLTDII